MGVLQHDLVALLSPFTRDAAAEVGRYIRGEKLVNVPNREEVGDHA